MVPRCVPYVRTMRGLVEMSVVRRASLLDVQKWCGMKTHTASGRLEVPHAQGRYVMSQLHTGLGQQALLAQ